MSGGGITEGVVEQAALDWFRSLGYATLPGAVLAPGGTAPERTSYDQVVLTGRLRDAALRINPDLLAGVVEQPSRACCARSRRTPWRRTSASSCSPAACRSSTAPPPRSTRSVFGDYIDVYDLTRAVEDGATVRIYYESRLAKVSLPADALETLDALADEITEGAEEAEATRAKTKWARLEAIVGAEDPLDMVAADLVEHWSQRPRPGKAIVVAMSRWIAVEQYDRLVALHPDWHDDDPARGIVKVVMTGSAADPARYQPHLHSKEVRKQLKARAKAPDDPLEIVIVRDMWLTGFDAPAMHTCTSTSPCRAPVSCRPSPGSTGPSATSPAA